MEKMNLHCMAFEAVVMTVIVVTKEIKLVTSSSVGLLADRALRMRWYAPSISYHECAGWDDVSRQCGCLYAISKGMHGCTPGKCVNVIRISVMKSRMIGLGGPGVKRTWKVTAFRQIYFCIYPTAISGAIQLDNQHDWHESGRNRYMIAW